jgi:alpha-L-arabinofuranosidase
VYGPWQVGQMTASQYAFEAKRWAHAFKCLDPKITLISCGDTGLTDWDRQVVQGVVGHADMHSIHM